MCRAEIGTAAVGDSHCMEKRIKSSCLAQVLKLLANYIPGTKGVGHKTELYGVPYSLSEDFVSSYRMHPLIPDELIIDGDKVNPLYVPLRPKPQE